jgi:hypothetical protein
LLTPKGIREKSIPKNNFIERKPETSKILQTEIIAIEEKAGHAAKATPAPQSSKQ